MLPKIKNRKNFGFTIIELIVVMAILGVLMTISLVALQGAQKSARDADRKSDLQDIRSALEIYRSDCGKYPNSITFGSDLKANEPGNDCNGKTYMSEVPSDPGRSNDIEYRYNKLSDTTYALCSILEHVGSSTASNCGGNCGTVACNYSVKNP